MANSRSFYILSSSKFLGWIKFKFQIQIHLFMLQLQFLHLLKYIYIFDNGYKGDRQKALYAGHAKI